MFSLIFLFLALIMVVIVLFAVVNTMTMNVLERTAEIGTVRAMGVRRASIRRLFLAEGAVLGALGATLGVVLAFIAIVLVNHGGLHLDAAGQYRSGTVPARLADTAGAVARHLARPGSGGDSGDVAAGQPSGEEPDRGCVAPCIRTVTRRFC